MSAVVLMYHRVADVPGDPYGLAVAPDRFAAHVERLQRQAGVVPLADVLAPGRSLRVAITFDDGYADNATTAAPLLADAGLPATYFITTARLGGQHFWWDRLGAALLGDHPRPAGVDVTVAGQDLWLALGSPEARLASLRFLHRRLRPLPPDELLATVDELLDRLAAPTPPLDASTMGVDQLTGLSRLPGVEIGAHTRTHLQLRGQSHDLQRDEVWGSMADLAAVLGHPVTSFAYPFGGASAVGDVAPRLARDAGCLVACTTDDGAVGPRTDPYRLPRLNVEDWDADELLARLKGIVTHG